MMKQTTATGTVAAYAKPLKCKSLAELAIRIEWLLGQSFSYIVDDEMAGLS